LSNRDFAFPTWILFAISSLRPAISFNMSAPSLNGSTTSYPGTQPTSNLNEAEAAALNARLASWSPRGQVATCCSAASCKDFIISLGVTQNVGLLCKVWRQYVDGKEEKPDLVEAFATSFGLCQRRCPSQIQLCVRQLIDHVPAASFTPDLAVRVAYITADGGTKDDVRALLNKCAGKELPHSFYIGLLRLATETMSPPDMNLALDILDRLEASNGVHSTASLKQLCIGFARMPKPPLEPAIRVMQFRTAANTAPIEACLTNAFFNILDSAVGPDARLAGEFVKTLPAETVHAPIQPVCSQTPALHKGDGTAPITYLLVDPCTVDLSGPISLPPHTHLCFLYSTLRQMDQRAQSVCTTNPTHRKLADIRTLLSSNPNAMVVPYDVELTCRADLPADSDRPNTAQDRLVLFAKITHAASKGAYKIKLVTNDPHAVKAGKAAGLDVIASLAAAPEATSTNPTLHPFECIGTGAAVA
jgi:hypothetical protein